MRYFTFYISMIKSPDGKQNIRIALYQPLLLHTFEPNIMHIIMPNKNIAF